MIDNIEIIFPFLKFESKDDFYFLQILQRKKENPELGSNSRVIRNYFIDSQEYLVKRYDEIKNLCQVFNARAMLRLNKRSHRKVAFKTIQNTANCISNEEYSHIDKAFLRACGDGHNDPQKKWIVDIDFKPTFDYREITKIINFINEIEPEGDKFLADIPSKNGVHLLTKTFNVQYFKVVYPEIDIHKDNPVNLFIP